MDDLSNLDWSSQKHATEQPAPSASQRLTPSIAPLSPQILSRPNSIANRNGMNGSPFKNASPSSDSFSSLLPAQSLKAGNTNLTLQDRQRQLQAERERQIREQQQRNAQEGQLLDRLGSSPLPPEASRSTHAARTVPIVPDGKDIDDLLAAFNSTTSVDKSSHFPPQADQEKLHFTDTIPSSEYQNEDDDPFGLGTASVRLPKEKRRVPITDDDDILGALTGPAPKQPMKPESPEIGRGQDLEAISSALTTGKNFDRQVAELVDMGFPPDRAEIALDETDGNLQRAVSWLLNQAHAEAQSKTKSRPGSRSRGFIQQPEVRPSNGVPAWMKSDSRSSSQHVRPSSATSSNDRDVTQRASEVGTAIFKSANSLWNAGRKQVQRAVADFQQDGDPGQPKWMRDASTESRRSDFSSSRQSRLSDPSGQPTVPHVTDEALLLESSDGRPHRPTAGGLKSSHRTHNEPPVSSPLRGRSPAQVLPERAASGQQRFSNPPPPSASSRPVKKLTREQVEEQSSQAYVSAARRRKPAVAATVPGRPKDAVDLFSSPTTQAKSYASGPTLSHSRPAISLAPVKPLSLRQGPSVSPSILAESTLQRSKGTAAFKRGDFDTAHTHYSSALTGIPVNHPIRIVILSNRSLTALKTGDTKLSISDADEALALIGPSKGEKELIDLGADGQKPIRDYYGKVLSRKAEALEHLEKWDDAAAVWKEAVEAGVGGLVAARGRDRCLKAAAPKPVQPSQQRPKPAPRPAVGAQPNKAGASQEAVQKLRAQNAAAEKLDDERFVLGDAVEAKVEAWRGGKRDNLRALLGSLETVLWEGAGWKKVGMSELIQNNKVKIIYMKAIARVHPDKIPQDATTEQRMISGSVFSTLNEAWDKFKADNGM